MVSGTDMAAGVPAALLNGSAPGCHHTDGAAPVTPLSAGCPADTGQGPGPGDCAAGTVLGDEFVHRSG